MNVNKLILGDNLDIMKSMDSESVDLVYLDPPFFSNRNYEVIWGDAGEVRSFQDRWAGGIDHYIAWLKERVEQMHRLLKKTGSIFLHCDWHADAYIRVQILDRIFGVRNFRSEIVWKRQTAKKGSQFQRRNFGNYADKIFFYSKSGKYRFYLEKTRHAEEENALIRRYGKVDADGRRFRVDHIELIEAMARKNLVYEYNGYTPKYGWMMTKDKLEAFDRENRIYWSESGKPYRKYFLDEYEGKELTNIWDDITIAQGNERIGYPTQKPEALLERVIKCASNEGDIVLDPFVGGGTTVAAADKLNRKWIGIDQSAMAVKVSDLRLQRQADMFSAPYTVQLHKYDYDELNEKAPHEFETWIILQFGGVPQNKKGGDGGVDGKAADGTPIQVKQSKNIGVNVVKNFSVSAKQYDKPLFQKNVKDKKPVGHIIAFSFGKGAVQEAARLKNDEDIIIKLVTVDEIVPVAYRPLIKLDVSELERDDKGSRRIRFTAQGKSGAGIEFYSWDFEYSEEKGFKPSVIIDKDGIQTVAMDAGTHTIAVKAIDNDGMENTEVITLKVNGAVERL